MNCENNCGYFSFLLNFFYMNHFNGRLKNSGGFLDVKTKDNWTLSYIKVIVTGGHALNSTKIFNESLSHADMLPSKTEPLHQDCKFHHGISNHGISSIFNESLSHVDIAFKNAISSGLNPCRKNLHCACLKLVKYGWQKALDRIVKFNDVTHLTLPDMKRVREQNEVILLKIRKLANSILWK